MARNCKKNQRSMYYALYSDKIPILDDDGNPTLEYKDGFLNPVPFKASLSSGKAEAEENPFGTSVSYDRIISTCEMDIPIDANTVIWYKNTVTYNDDGTVNGNSADYKVSAPPLDGLDSLRIAIKYQEKTS